MSREPQVLVDEHAVVDFRIPESPRWREDRFWWVETMTGTVYTVDLAGNVETIAVRGEPVAGLGFLPDGSPILVQSRTQNVVSLGSGDPSTYVDLAGVSHGSEFLNDMVVDEHGRAYVGTRMPGGLPFFFTKEDIGDTVVLVDTSRNARVVARGVVAPNGMSISPDGKTLYLAESRAQRITCFDIEDDGSLTNQRLFGDTPGRTSPDGICLDADGAIWYAGMYAGEFVRLAPGGEVLERVSVGGQGVCALACALGGPDRKVLFMVSCRAPSPDEGRDEGWRVTINPGPGIIHVLDVDVAGAGLN